MRSAFVHIKHWIFMAVNAVLRYINLELCNRSTLALHVDYAMSLLYHTNRGNEVTPIIFSRNRAMQLDGLLRSMMRYCSHYQNPVIIYDFSHMHSQSYEQLQSMWPELRWTRQADFSTDLYSVLPQTGKVLLLVDDVLFRSHVDFRDFDCIDAWSTVSLHGIQQSLGLYFPLGVTANIYYSNELRAMLSELDYHNPNTLELEMQKFIRYFGPDRIQYVPNPAPCICVAENRVQETVKSSTVGVAADRLLSLWDHGYKVDIDNSTTEGLKFNKVCG